MANNLAEKIKAEQKKLEGLKQKRAAIDESIRKSEAALARYRMAEESSQYNVIAEAAAGSGISVEALIAALKGGDMLSLQEQIEAAATTLGGTAAAEKDAARDTEDEAADGEAGEDTEYEDTGYEDTEDEKGFGSGFGGGIF